jgi:hypothetical protein
MSLSRYGAARYSRKRRFRENVPSPVNLRILRWLADSSMARACDALMLKRDRFEGRFIGWAPTWKLRKYEEVESRRTPENRATFDRPLPASLTQDDVTFVGGDRESIINIWRSDPGARPIKRVSCSRVEESDKSTRRASCSSANGSSLIAARFNGQSAYSDRPRRGREFDRRTRRHPSSAVVSTAGAP